MSKEYVVPQSELIHLNLDENIASSGTRYWVNLGEIGEEEHLFDGEGSIDELLEALRKRFGK